MTKKDLVESIMELGIQKEMAYDIVELILFEIKNALIKNERIMIFGFGTFEIKERKNIVARNIKTGQEIIISRKIPVFKIGKTFKKKLNI